MISVIIPTFNEEELLTATLYCIDANKTPHEIIVVDAGSDDDTVKIVENASARVLHSPLRQRAAQMNYGVKESKGDSLLFLHADTYIPGNAIDCVEQVLANNKVVGGAFTRRFDHPSLFLKLTCQLADIRSRLFGWHFGDQGIFVKRSIFDKVGGFLERNNLEDLDFSCRLKNYGKVVTLNPPLLSSGRRFGQSPIRRTLKDFLITFNYLVDKIQERIIHGLGYKF